MNSVNNAANISFSSTLNIEINKSEFAEMQKTGNMRDRSYILFCANENKLEGDSIEQKRIHGRKQETTFFLSPLPRVGTSKQKSSKG